MRSPTDNNVVTGIVPLTDMKTGGAATSPPSYDDFEPFCTWQREEGQETLVVHVPEFKKEQMKVRISNRGTLKITGERPIDGPKHSRFSKEIIIPKDCNVNEVTAKFTTSGRLYIRMPKKITSMVTKQDQPTPVQQPQQNQQHPKPECKQDQVAEKLAPVAESVVRGGWKLLLVVVAVVAAVGAYAICKHRVSDYNVGAILPYSAEMYY